MTLFENFNTTIPTVECIAACIFNLEGLHVDDERRHNDLIEMDYPILFADLENFETGDAHAELVEMSLDLKENVKLKRV